MAKTERAPEPNIPKPSIGSHEIGSVTVSSISSNTEPVDVNNGLTKIKISYPKDFKGNKFYQDGDEKFVSAESAKQFVELGIATIMK
jgi:hypothetical protein